MSVARVAVVLLRPRDGLIEPDPVDAGHYFSTEDIARARRYERPQLALHLAAALTQGAMLLACVTRERQKDPPTESLASVLWSGIGLSLAGKLAPLPLRTLARKRAVRSGLVTQSWRGWAVDLVKGTIIQTSLAGAGAIGVEWVRSRHPRHWWLAVAGASVAGEAILTFLAPVVIAPIFNRFEVLDDGPLREDVLELAARAGVNIGEVYRMDASTRTSAANAYVTGLGPTKHRVVLFDTLLESFTAQEVRLVVAHELAHIRHRDVPRGLALMALTTPASVYATVTVAERLMSDTHQPSSAARLSALTLAAGLLGALVGSVGSALSRRVESRADAFALALTDEPDSFIAFERRIVAQNLSDPAPHPWLTSLIASHPPAVRRIGTALAYRRAAR